MSAISKTNLVKKRALNPLNGMTTTSSERFCVLATKRLVGMMLMQYVIIAFCNMRVKNSKQVIVNPTRS